MSNNLIGFVHTECFIYYRKYILQITQPSPYRCTQLQCRFAVISEAVTRIVVLNNRKQIVIFVTLFYTDATSTSFRGFISSYFSHFVFNFFSLIKHNYYNFVYPFAHAPCTQLKILNDKFWFCPGNKFSYTSIWQMFTIFNN